MQLNNNSKIILQVKDNQEYLLKDCIYNSQSRLVFDSYQEEATKKKDELKKKRAAHYNEFQMLQKAKQKQWDSD